MLCWGLAAALLLATQNAYSQPAYPPAGAGLQPPPTQASRQAAAAIQAPANRPQNSSTYPPYPPPTGYTYPPPPPGYGPGTRPAQPKAAAKGKPSTKTATAKKPAAGPPQLPKVYGPTGDLTSQVTKIRDNDKVQDMRIGNLERDVGSIKRGGKGGTRYDGGSDLTPYTTYVARPGDTLFHIASTHRVSVGEVQQLNRMSENEVHVGQTLLIPSPNRASSAPLTTQISYTPPSLGGSPAPVSAPVSAPVTMVKVSTPLYYTVKKGDSLKAIAHKYKLAPATLARANKVKDVNKIAVGQRLKIPGHTTTKTVATRSKTPRTASSDTVPLAGYAIPSTPPPPAAGLGMVPAPMPAAPPPAAAPKAPDTSDSHRGILAYRVDRSDTIESIATQFTTTPTQIREMNRLNADSILKAGDEIMVPAMGAVSVNSR